MPDPRPEPRPQPRPQPNREPRNDPNPDRVKHLPEHVEPSEPWPRHTPPPGD